MNFDEEIHQTPCPLQIPELLKIIREYVGSKGGEGKQEKNIEAFNKTSRFFYKVSKEMKIHITKLFSGDNSIVLVDKNGSLYYFGPDLSTCDEIEKSPFDFHQIHSPFNNSEAIKKIIVLEKALLILSELGELYSIGLLKHFVFDSKPRTKLEKLALEDNQIKEPILNIELTPKSCLITCRTSVYLRFASMSTYQKIARVDDYHILLATNLLMVNVKTDHLTIERFHQFFTLPSQTINLPCQKKDIKELQLKRHDDNLLMTLVTNEGHVWVAIADNNLTDPLVKLEINKKAEHILVPDYPFYGRELPSLSQEMTKEPLNDLLTELEISSIGQFHQINFPKNRDGSLSPIVSLQYSITTIGNKCIFYIAQDGSVYAAGHAKYGKLGLGEVEEPLIYFPQKIEGLHAVAKIASTDINTFFLNHQGEVAFCGKTPTPQLTLSNIFEREAPHSVSPQKKSFK